MLYEKNTKLEPSKRRPWPVLYSRPTGGGSERQPTSVVASSFPYIAAHKGPRAPRQPIDDADNRHSHQTRRRRRSFDTVCVCVCICVFCPLHHAAIVRVPTAHRRRRRGRTTTTTPPPHHHRILGPPTQPRVRVGCRRRRRRLPTSVPVVSNRLYRGVAQIHRIHLTHTRAR